MVKRNLTSKLLTPKVLLVAVIFVVLILLAYVQLKDTMTNVWPDQQTIMDKIKQLKREQARLQEVLNEAHRLEEDKKSFAKYAKGFWFSDRDGNVETVAHKMIEGASRSVGLELTSIGRVQSSKVCEGVQSMEINLSTKAPMAKIGDFIYKIHQNNPRFHWHRLTLRPDNLRDPKNVVMNGNIRFVYITDEDIIKLALDK